MKNKEINNSERPWGRYYVIEDNENYKIKRIEVNPKGRLSYQYHMKRAESWTIIQGQGIVTIDGVEQKVSAGESIKINKEAKHRILNSGDTLLVFIEVQTGTYFGEDDIVRIAVSYTHLTLPTKRIV